MPSHPPPLPRRCWPPCTAELIPIAAQRASRTTNKAIQPTRRFTANNHGFTGTQAHSDRAQVYVISGGGKWNTGALSLATDISYQHSRVRNQNFILDTLKTQNTITFVVIGININNSVNYCDSRTA